MTIPGMQAPKLVVPERFARNAPAVRAAGPERSAAAVMGVVCERLGLADLAGEDVLDVGCGVRFTQAILNLGLPVRSYTGVDIDREMIAWLQGAVTDPRFRFAYWDVRSPRYNPAAPRMTRGSRLPVETQSSLVWLFSVFTHLLPDDADAMFHVLHRHVRPGGRLFFTCFLDAAVDEFVDEVPGEPAAKVRYSERRLLGMAEAAGWEVVSVHDKDPARFVQHQVVCRPKEG